MCIHASWQGRLGYKADIYWGQLRAGWGSPRPVVCLISSNDFYMAVIEDWKKWLQSIFFCCQLGGNISSLWHFLQLPWHLLVIRKRREMWGRGTSMESSSQCQDANCCFENWNSKNGRKQQTSRKHPAARTAGILFLVKHKYFSGWGSVEGMSNLPFSKEYFELNGMGEGLF